MRNTIWAITTTAIVIGLLASPPASAKKKAGIPPTASLRPTAQWTDQDSKLAAKALIERCLAQPFIARYRRSLRRRPRVAIAPFRNRSSEHISAYGLTDAVRAALTKSKKVRALGAKSRKPADLLLSGTIYSMGDVSGNKELKYRAIVAQLIDIKSGEKLWIDLYESKRLIIRAHFKVGGAAGKKPTDAKTPTPPAVITRLNPRKMVDLSGAFNDSDMRLAVAALARDFLRAVAKNAGAKRLVIRGYRLRNRTSQHLPAALFSAAFEAQIVGSPLLRIAAGRMELSQARAMRATPGPPTRGPRAGLAVDWVLSGSLSATSEAPSKKKIITTYHLTMEAADVNKSAKTWVKVHAIKKMATPAKPW